uniref:Uncharacterized protein n=1 Tax=Eptatretus burgeri TaxID=7764 RepID=A0A8C4QL57_EPTBU
MQAVVASSVRQDRAMPVTAEMQGYTERKEPERPSVTRVSEKAPASSTTSQEDDRPSPSYSRERRNALTMPSLGQIPEESTISANDHLVPPVTAEKKGLMGPRIVRSAVNMSNGDCHGAIVNGLIRASTYPLDPRNGCFNSPYGPHPLFPGLQPPVPVDSRHHEGRYHYDPTALHPLHGTPVLSGAPAFADVPLLRVSPQRLAAGVEAAFGAGPLRAGPHPLVAPYVEQYLRSMHSSPSLSVISAARGLSPTTSENCLMI